MIKTPRLSLEVELDKEQSLAEDRLEFSVELEGQVSYWCMVEIRAMGRVMVRVKVVVLPKWGERGLHSNGTESFLYLCRT